jgi:hypothetical protein
MPKTSLSQARHSDVANRQHRDLRIPYATAIRRWSRRSAAVLCGTALLLLVNSGCQCVCCGTNACSASVDCGVDHAIPFDGCYCSWLDLTRIGRPGGMPGRCCCSCPADCCNPGVVYAHRWNSPPAQDAAPSAGLQNVPNFPAAEPGPYFPPANRELDREGVSPLFDPEETPLPGGPMPTVPATESPMAIGRRRATEAGVVRTHFTRESTGRESLSADNQPAWVLPIEAVFAN